MPDTVDQHPSGFSLDSILYLIFRNKWLILSGAVIGAAAAATAYVVTPRAYRSEAKLLVRYVTDTVTIDPELTGGQILKPGRPGENIINTEVEILASADTAEKAVRRIGLDKVQFSTRPEATNVANLVTFVLRNLRIEAPKNSNVIRVFFDAPTPSLAQQVLSSLVHEYLTKHIEVHRDAGAFEFLSQQADQARAKLNDTEEELKRLKGESGIVSMADAKITQAGRVNELEKQLRETDAAIATSKARIEALRAILAAKGAISTASLQRPRGSTATPDLQSIRQRLLTLRVKEAELLATYNDDSLPVLNVRAEIAQLEGSIRGLTPAGVDTNSAPVQIFAPTLSSLDYQQEALLAEQANLAGLMARMGTLKQQMTKVSEDLQRTESAETAIMRLERTREMQEQSYRYFSQRLEQARVDNALDASKVSNIAVVQPPTLPSDFVQKELMRNLLMMFLACLGAGVGLAAVREFMLDRSLRRPGEIEPHLKVPLFMTVPFLSQETKSRKTASPPRALLDTSLKPYAEALRDRLMTATSRESSPRMIGIAACHDDAGVTSICRTLANAFTESGDARVLLVTPPHIAATGLLTAGAPSSPRQESGEATTGATTESPDSQADAGARSTPRPGVGSINADEYDMVLFALPPITDTSSALRIVPYLDGVVFVAESERSMRDNVKRAFSLLQSQGVPVLGVIFNKHRPYVPRFLGQH